MVMKVLHWVFAVLIPLYIVVVGSQGWDFLIAIPVAIVTFFGLVALAIVVTVRRPPFSALFIVLSIVMWVVSLGFPLTLEGGGDGPVIPAVFTDLGVPDPVNAVLLWMLPIASFVLWLATLLALLIHRRRVEPAAA